MRWEAIEKENQAIKQAKEQGIKYIPITLVNDDTPNNFWLEVAISLLKSKINGRIIKGEEQNYDSKTISLYNKGTNIPLS